MFILAKGTIHVMNSLTRLVPIPKSHNFLTVMWECFKSLGRRCRAKAADGSVNVSMGFQLLCVLWSRST